MAFGPGRSSDVPIRQRFPVPAPGRHLPFIRQFLPRTRGGLAADRAATYFHGHKSAMGEGSYMPDQRIPASSNQKALQRGFGLVELMITISMIAVLTAIALPSYSYLIRGSRVTNETNDFLTALNLARNEAITRSRSVTICAADTTGEDLPDACGTSTDWVKGWMVFVDDAAKPSDPTPVAIEPERIVRTWVGNTHNTLSPGAATAFIRFNNRGQSNIADKLTFTLMPSSDCSNQQKREIVVNSLGRSGSSKVDCS